MRVLIFALLMSLLASCGGGGTGNVCAEGDTIRLRYARLLTMVDYGDYVKAEFRNPWDTTRVLQTFVLVPRGLSPNPSPVGRGDGVVVRVPLERSVVYTSVHGSLLCELGATEAITGVCDARYIYNPVLRKRIESGEIADCGSSMAPNIERILMLEPEALLLSAFENSNDHNKVGQTGIPIIDCTDYMETSPLGRAEWMRFYGRLYGCADVADSLFNITEEAYLRLRETAAHVESRPAVLTDLIYGQTWSAPGAYSTTGVMIEDAGGRNPFDGYKRSGGVQLAPEEVLYTAQEADIWLIKYAQAAPLTLTQLGRDNGIYTKFRPYATGNVWGCNTEYSTIFEEAAFHPHWLLTEYVSLLHPELQIDSTYHHHYYSKVGR